MDLQCKRALGPLRRYDFVAPAANPVGFSVGFMMASKRNPFIGELVRNLDRYNRHWLMLPYPTVNVRKGPCRHDSRFCLAVGWASRAADSSLVDGDTALARQIEWAVAR